VLAQQPALQHWGRRMNVAEFRTIIRSTGVTIHDGDDEDDNVPNTNADYPRLDIYAMAQAIMDLAPGSISGRVWNDQDADGTQDAGENGLANWTVFADQNGNGVYDGAQSDLVFSSTDVPMTILDNGTTTSTVVVSGLGRILTDLNVTLDITHDWDSELLVFLLAPSGVRVRLFGFIGAMEQDFTNTTLDDTATTLINNGTAPYTGTYRPQEPLRWFSGLPADGTWTLEIHDVQQLITGTLNSWSLSLSVAAEPAVTTNVSGDYALSGLAAGSHSVRTAPPVGWQPTIPSTGIRTIALTPGQNATGANFGYALQDVLGTSGNDVIRLIPRAGDSSLVDVYLNSNPSFPLYITGANYIRVDGLAGNDRLDASDITAILVSLVGGDGNDTLLGASMDDTLEGGAGQDTLQFDWGTRTLDVDLGAAPQNIELVTVTGGELTLDATQHLQGVTITAGKLTMMANGSRALVTSSLTINVSVGAKLDLKDNDMIVHGGSLSGLTAWIKCGLAARAPARPRSCSARGSMIWARPRR